MRLFCFHHAGGGGLAFNAWRKALSPAVEDIPVEVADRQRFTTMRQLVDEVNDQLRSTLHEPHVFFGHSFGALLAYRLACAPRRVSRYRGQRRGDQPAEFAPGRR